MTKTQRDVAKTVAGIRGEMVRLSDAIHANPEEALLEFRSADLCEAALKRHGFRVERPFRHMPTAFIAAKGTRRPAIGILAEYDALPNCGPDGGVGHGCGHNLLGAAAIAGAIAAASVLEARKKRGTIRLFGTPAEETLVGKCYMARDGAFDRLDACLAWHPGDLTRAANASWSANDSITFEFFGRTAHAAGCPEKGRSALDAVEIMNVAVNFLREHVEENVRIHYAVTDGGEVPNVVPDRAKSWYFVRGKNREQLEAVKARVIRCARGAALATETSLKVTTIAACYNHLTNDALFRAVERNLRGFGAPRFTMADEKGIRRLGIKGRLARGVSKPERGGLRPSSDEANVSWITPLARFDIACWAKDSRGHSTEIHLQANTRAAHKGMILAAKVFGATAVDLVTDGKTLAAARAEFRKKTRGFKYDPVVPKNQKPPIRDSVARSPREVREP